MINLQTMIDNALKAERQETLKSSPQLTLGELISKLEKVEKDSVTVRFDFEYIRPSGIDSWRGSYEELALSFDLEGSITVKELLVILKDAVGKTFTGYKGGEFLMSKHTPIWVANYGNSGSTGVVDVIDEKYEVILKTDICEL